MMTLNVFNASELFRTTKNAESLNSRKKGSCYIMDKTCWTLTEKRMTTADLVAVL